MKKLLLVIVLVIFCGIFREANAQCVATPTDNCVSVHQSILDRAAKALDTLKAAEATIAAFQNERGATDAERKAWVSFKEITESAIAIFQKGIADRDTVITLQQKALDLYATLVEKLTKEINKPKSAWSKFVQIIKEVALVTLGLTIGGKL